LAQFGRAGQPAQRLQEIDHVAQHGLQSFASGVIQGAIDAPDEVAHLETIRTELLFIPGFRPGGRRIARVKDLTRLPVTAAIFANNALFSRRLATR
jgi:hypothetical protein